MNARSEAARRAALARWAGMTPEQRSAQARDRWEGMTEQQRAAQVERLRTADRIKKYSPANRRQRAQLHASNVGRKQSPETIEKKRIAAVAQWAQRRSKESAS